MRDDRNSCKIAVFSFKGLEGDAKVDLPDGSYDELISGGKIDVKEQILRFRSSDLERDRKDGRHRHVERSLDNMFDTYHNNGRCFCRSYEMYPEHEYAGRQLESSQFLPLLPRQLQERHPSVDDLSAGGGSIHI